jgi:hypothetical protein
MSVGQLKEALIENRGHLVPGTIVRGIGVHRRRSKMVRAASKMSSAVRGSLGWEAWQGPTGPWRHRSPKLLITWPQRHTPPRPP